MEDENSDPILESDKERLETDYHSFYNQTEHDNQENE